MTQVAILFARADCDLHDFLFMSLDFLRLRDSADDKNKLLRSLLVGRTA